MEDLRRLSMSKTAGRIVAELDAILKPIHYRAAHQLCAVFEPCGRPYSPKTDPAEKVRQMAAEHSELAVVNGLIYKRSWFFCEQQSMSFHRRTFPMHPLSPDDGCCAGYDMGRRHDYMIDHFNDQNSDRRQQTRKDAALIEHSTRLWFAHTWPDFYKEASNTGDYKTPTVDDFSLKINNKWRPVDVKTYQASSLIRNMKDTVIYICASWQTPCAVVEGCIWRSMFSQYVPRVKQQLHCYTKDYLLDPTPLFVLLNMQSMGLNYRAVKEALQ